MRRCTDLDVSCNLLLPLSVVRRHDEDIVRYCCANAAERRRLFTRVAVDSSHSGPALDAPASQSSHGTFRAVLTHVRDNHRDVIEITAAFPRASLICTVDHSRPQLN